MSINQKMTREVINLWSEEEKKKKGNSWKLFLKKKIIIYLFLIDNVLIGEVCESANGVGLVDGKFVLLTCTKELWSTTQRSLGRCPKQSGPPISDSCMR